MRRVDHPQFWQSVTGSLTWEESNPRQTAIRELKEETGISAISGLRDLETSHQYEIFPEWRHCYAPGTTQNTEHVFALELTSSEPIKLNPEEHSEYQWLGFDEAITLATSHTNRDAIAWVRDQFKDVANG